MAYSRKKHSDYGGSHGVHYVVHAVNEDLSDAYWEVATCTFRKIKKAKDDSTYRILKNRIASADIDIERFYLNNNSSLEKLKIDGIGPKTKTILQDIMKDGLDAAILAEFERRKKQPFTK